MAGKALDAAGRGFGVLNGPNGSLGFLKGSNGSAGNVRKSWEHDSWKDH